jgi:hypothetical protein
MPVINEVQLDLDKVHMNAVDEIYTAYPFYGTRRLKVELFHEYDIDIGRLRIAHLMERLGIAAIYPKPNLSKPAPNHEKFPYLLRNLAITRPHQVWGSGHHLHQNSGGLRLPDRVSGLVFTLRRSVAPVTDDGDNILR